jgi:oligosaccharide translocation protein RFT1
VVRIVFQPLEESARLYFSRTIKADSKVTRLEDVQPYQVLANILHVSFALPLVTSAFIPPVGSIMMPYLIPPQYLKTSAPSTLIAYMTLYLPIMSVNGILEAFFSATMDTQKVARQSGVMAGCSLIFGGTLAVIRQIRKSHVSWASDLPGEWTTPELSLVYANTLQMICRIIFAGRHAAELAERNVGSRKPLRWRPGMLTIVAVVASGVCTRAIPLVFQLQVVAKLLTVASCGVFCLLCLYVTISVWRLYESKLITRQTTQDSRRDALLVSSPNNQHCEQRGVASKCGQKM